VDVGILGPFVVRRDGSEITVGAAKQRALLALLVLGRDEVVSTETLVEELWGGRPPATATKIVHGYVSQLRKALGDGVLQTRPGGYRLRLSPEDVDAARFELLLERGLSLLGGGDPDTAAAVLREALALWRGPPLAEFRFQDFAANETRRLDELRLLALERCLEADIATGNHATSVPELQALIGEHPLRETLRRLLMLALYRAGRQAEALAVYRDARSALVEEMGLDPSEELQRLEAAILAHDPALDLPTGVAVVSTEVLPRADPSPRIRRRRPIHHRGALVVATAAVLSASCVVALLLLDEPRTDPTTPVVDSLGFIDAHGNGVTDQVPMRGEPGSLAVGAGAIWTSDAMAGTVARIDPTSHSVVETIPVGLDPGGIAVGGGSVWVANHYDNTVSRISSDTNAVVGTIPVGAGPVAVASGYGSIWITNGDDRTLTRIDAATGEVRATIRTNAVGRGVAVGSGSVWVTDEATGRVVVVDPGTNAVTSTARVGTGPTGIAYGAGSIWVVNALDGTVSRVDANTLIVQATIPVPGGPSAISFASDTIWVSAEFALRVVHIDAVRAVITASTAIGSRPEGLVATRAGVWVAVQATGAGHRGGRLIVIGGGPGSIDPSVGDIFPDLNGPAYDGLTSLRHVGGSAGTQIVPDLAAALPQPTADGTSYTFRLRPLIRYSDGRLLQAVDFRRGLERILELHGTYATSFSHIVGAAECIRRPRCDLTRGISVEGTSGITFRLSTPDPRLFEELQYLIPVPVGTPMRDVGTTPVPGTGPYGIQSYVPGHLLTFERNRYFHVWSEAARPDGYPDEIAFRIADDQDAALQELLAGHADLVHLNSAPPSLTQLAAQHPRQVHLDDEQSVVFVFLNTRRPPFDDVRVRRALNYAVDRGRVIGLSSALLARPTCQIVPPSATGYRPYCPYTINPDSRGRWHAPDLAKARSLVAASGSTGRNVKLWTFSQFITEARYIVTVLDQLGYHASVHEIADTDTYFRTLDKTPNAQAGMFGWFSDPLAVDMLSTLTCGSLPNPAHFCDRNIDAQIERLAEHEPSDPAGTSDLAAELDRKLTDQAPWVPLFAPRSVDATSARVGNYQAQLGQVLMDQLWVN
jgi:peptide/nickel transport system substrate-binding protein